MRDIVSATPNEAKGYMSNMKGGNGNSNSGMGMGSGSSNMTGIPIMSG
jgi:hypothetical protein